MPRWFLLSLRRWRTERVELLGTAKHAAPVVYAEMLLPGMHGAKNLTPRQLDEFEEAGLAALQHGDDLATLPDGESGLRMLGSIRAMRNCMSCHEVPQGTLLGALSYRLRP